MTQAVCLLNFGLAARMNSRVPSVLPFALHNRTLAYISPEQTGRMNRVVDYRTDLYVLGLLFYEWLTGRPPFQSEDTLELMHWHMARTPVAPAEFVPALPTALSLMVLKLLAQTAEERYLSALGLQRDLERCAAEWTADCPSITFVLGQHDMSERFLLPQQLYGRAREVTVLLQAFDTICQGHRAMMLVEGYSGIGKTALIQELYKLIVRQKGYFISGKFDQVVQSESFRRFLKKNFLI